MASIVLKNVTKRFGSVAAVDKLDLEIEDGSFTTLLGPSGCGKTTTLRMIAGLETPSNEGEIWIGDRCVYSASNGDYIPPAQRKLGLVFQSYALWPHLTVFDNIAFGLQIGKQAKAEIVRKVGHIAEILYIGDLLQRFPNELSGGQQQRVAIARVLVMEPAVLLLDEPLSNLDSKLRMDMRAELKRLHAETKSTIIYVTHDQLEALTMSTKVAVMNLGKLQQYEDPMSVYHFPANTFTADFIGNPKINFFQGVVTPARELPGKGVVVTAGELTVRIDDATMPPAAGHNPLPVKVGVRSEDFVVSASPGEGLVQGSVYSILPAGSQWYLKIRIGGEIVTATVYHDPELDIDDPVWVGVKPERVKCFDQSGELVCRV
ncbi:ABC transporter ATP-binding protein [Alkalispirochaeta alkalica]|uniref:ABC transporter ATP-binding protein n=1 Tax=Alkalispirochaeta alkalica TaxID=46356 RepID=UPI00038060E4|nr:ABC transporter ATP-binding protein [Alkalispirochaeta alkalica]